jgi:hypothetical protein
MKIVPFVIWALGGIIVVTNSFLLIYPKKANHYFLGVTLLTGFCLLSIVLLSIYSKRKLNTRQAKFIHKIFSKN